MKSLFVLLAGLMLVSGCATEATDDRVYATQVVTGWQDAEGHIHLKGEGGSDGYAVISEPRRYWRPLGWGGASR